MTPVSLTHASSPLRPSSPEANKVPSSAEASSPTPKASWGPFRLFPTRSPSPPPSPLFGTNLLWDGEQMVAPTSLHRGPTPAPAPAQASPPAPRFRLPSLGRSRSEVDLRGSKERNKDKPAGTKGSRANKAPMRSPEVPPVPCMPPPSPVVATEGLPTLTPSGQALPAADPGGAYAPLAPSALEFGLPTPTPQQGSFPRPALHERATTPHLPRRTQWTHSASSSLSSGAQGSFGSYGSFGSLSSGQVASPMRYPRSPDSVRSRPSTAHSAANVSPNALRSYPVTPPSQTDSGASLRSGGSSAYFGREGIHRNRQSSRVVALQAGWLQDDMLRDLNLGQASAKGAQGRRQRDLLLGALVNEVLDILGRALELTPEAAAALRERRDHLYATRSQAHCDEATTSCQLQQFAILHRLAARSVDDGAGRHRYRPERALRERHENDLARFFHDALDLPDVFDLLRAPLSREVRASLSRTTSAIAYQEAERLLRTLALTPAQQDRLATHLDRARQAALLASSQSSLDSSTTAEREETQSP